MYVWLNPNRRDRRSRKFEQVVPNLKKEDVATRVEEAKKEEQLEEETRRMLEIREMNAAVEEIKPIIDSFLKTQHGREEIRAVVGEMRRMKEEKKKNREFEEEASYHSGNSIDSETQLSTTKEIERKEKVRAIFEVFDADGSNSMDADELKDLLCELCLPAKEDDVEKLMVEMDEDESGEIDFEEFYSWYIQNASKLSKGQGLKILGMSIGKVIRNNIKGLGDLGEARRVIIAHAEHEAKMKAQRQFRLFRPPNFEALERSPFASQEDEASLEKKNLRFAPLNNLLYAEGVEARKLRLRRLGHSTLLYVPRTHLDDLPVNTRVVAAPSVGDGATGRRLKQWINGQSVEGLDAREGKRPGTRKFMLRSIRSPLTKAWHRTRTVHPTFSVIRAPLPSVPEGTVMVTKGKRRRLMPLIDRPLAAKLLKREDRNIDRLARTDISTYPAGSLMRNTVEPSMADLLAMLSHDLLEADKQGGGFAFVPVNSTTATVLFEWSGPVKKRCCLVMDGSEPQEMTANNDTQSFSLTLNLPAGRYTYRFQVDGSYTLRNDKPTARTGSSSADSMTTSPEEPTIGSGAFDPATVRNLLIVVPHSSDPTGDEYRKPVTTVSLPMRSLGDDGVWVLKQCLRLNKSVTCLDLPSNSISTDGACALGGLLAERPDMLVRLNLASNGIGYDGALALALGLQRNHSLTSLELYQNRLGDDGCETLAGGLQGHRALLNLELGSNFIHCDGASALASCLFGNYSVVKVGLSNNGIGTRGVDAICNLLLANHSLVDVDLSHNPNIGVKGAASIGKFLAHKDCALSCLGLSGCCLSGGKDLAGKAGIRGLAFGLSRNKSLLRLGLADNNIDNTGARELAVALQENTCLVSLDLESNTMDDEWFRPAHSLHTEQDPSIRSIASNILRNAHLHQVNGVNTIGSRYWDTGAGVPGMVITSGNKGDQVGARRERRAAKRLENDRLSKIRGPRGETDEDEATLAEAPYVEGDERNFVRKAVGDPLDVVAAAIKARKGLVGTEGKDGVWRLEGRWVRSSSAAPPSSLSPGTQTQQGPRWLSHVEAAAESAQRREVALAAAEKIRISEENDFIEASIARVQEDLPLFIQGHPCALEEQSGLGKKLVKALAYQVIAKTNKKRNATRARRKEVLSKQGATPEECWKLKNDYEKRCEREDVLEVFDSFDSDCSGTIDAEELAFSVQAFGLELELDELDKLMTELDDDNSGGVKFEEFFKWYVGGGIWKLLERGSTKRWLLVQCKKIIGVGPKFTPEARSKRLWSSVLNYQHQKKARMLFRRDRPPRRGCVCTSTGFAFPDYESLMEHKRTFDFDAFHVRSRKMAARERLCERAREALNAVPLYPCIMCFEKDVPAYIELTAYDIPDQRIGRPVGLVRVSDVVRCIEGHGAWLKVLLSTHPDGVWVFNEQPRHPEVLVPLEIGRSPGMPPEPEENKISRPKPKSKGKKPLRLRPNMVWYNDDDFETWFTPEPRLPRGAILKIRSRPDDDAQVVGGLAQAQAIKAVCSTGDWLMVAYISPAPMDEKDTDGEVRMVSKEGWMLFRSPLRVLLVPVTDPQLLYALEGSVSPTDMPQTPATAAAEEDSSSEEEEVSEDQRKELRKVAREMKKQLKKDRKKKKRN